VIRLLAPQFLLGLLLIAIPVIIHLFNFRRYRKAVFTNVRFLQELKEETTRMSRLKHLLVLASRILALLSLVLAFTQPVLPVSNAVPVQPGGAISIYLDNSFSMESQSSDGALLEVARRKAREIAAAFPPATRIQLLTNDFEAIHQRLYTREEFLDELERVKISPSGKALSEVALRQSEALHSASILNGPRFIISDFQRSFVDFENLSDDSLSPVSLVALPLQAPLNIYIDSCWLASPVVQLNKPVEVIVKLVNSSTEDAENIPVRLQLNGAQRAVASTGLEAGKSTEVTLTFSVNEPGWQQLEIEITDHPVTFDDHYFLAFDVREKLSVLSIDGNTAGPYLKAFFNQDPFFNYTAIPGSQVNYAAFKNQDVIILHQLPDISSGLSSELQRYIQQGGTIICFPDSMVNLASYSEFLTAVAGDNLAGLVRGNDKVNVVDLRHPVFQEVFENNRKSEGVIDYPSVTAHYVLGNSGKTNRRNLVKLTGGDPFLAEYASGRGSFYFFTVPLSPGFSNLARHALVVPMLYRMTILSMRSPSASYTLGESTPVLINNTTVIGDETLHLRNSKLNIDVAPVVKSTASGMEMLPGPSVQLAGNYILSGTSGTIAGIALNYNRSESPMDFLPEEDLMAAAEQVKGTAIRVYSPETGDLTKSIGRENEGIALWKYCLIATLLFLLAETLILRYWRTT
jgi:hypothetical protein